MFPFSAFDWSAEWGRSLLSFPTSPFRETPFNARYPLMDPFSNAGRSARGRVSLVIARAGLGEGSGQGSRSPARGLGAEDGVGEKARTLLSGLRPGASRVSRHPRLPGASPGVRGALPPAVAFPRRRGRAALGLSALASFQCSHSRAPWPNPSFQTSPKAGGGWGRVQSSKSALWSPRRPPRSPAPPSPSSPAPYSVRTPTPAPTFVNP